MVANYCCGSEVYVSLPQAEEAWIETFHTIAIELYNCCMHSVKFIANISVLYLTISVTITLYSCYDIV